MGGVEYPQERSNVSQEQSTEAQRAEARTQDTRAFVRRVRTLTRRKYTPEEKIRIVLEGFRREVTVSDLCRREGIKAGAYYEIGRASCRERV